MDRNKRIFSLLVTLAITLACVPALPAVAPLPTQPVGAVDTMIAGTYAAASTSTAMNTTPTPTLSDTLTPSRTPTITPTGTATIIFKTPTMFSVGGGSSSGGSSGGSSSGSGTSTGNEPPVYSCKLVKLTPAYGAHLKRNRNFIMTWRVVNTGNIVWDHNSVDYMYLSGTPMHTQSLYDIPISVGPNRQVDLSVRMQVPSKKGTYVTTWTMKVGSDTFCTLEQMIIAD